MITAGEIHGDARAAEYLAGWQRAQAELENYRRRQAAEHAAARARLTEEVLSPLLEIADNFRAAAGHVPPEIAAHAWTEGMMHIGRQIEQLLAAYGITLIEDAGIAFNPQLHEAVGTQAAKEKSGTVVEVVQPGYRVGERVIRPARVKVSA